LLQVPLPLCLTYISFRTPVEYNLISIPHTIQKFKKFKKNYLLIK